MENKTESMEVDTQKPCNGESNVNFEQQLSLVMHMSAQRLDFPI